MDQSKFKVGDLVFFTRAAELWMRETRPTSPVGFITGKLARVAEVIDWESERGRTIKASRDKLEKWSTIPNADDYRFVLDIFFPEMPSGEEQGAFGLVLPDVVPEFFSNVEGSEDPLPLFLKTTNTFQERLQKGLYQAPE